MKELPKVIGIDKDKCVNCHRCISVCPVKYCNDGSQDYIRLNHNLCIGCGNCLDACTHDARIVFDDFSAFMEAIERKDDLVAIAAPSIAVQFPNSYLRLNGWLKSIGIRAIFDVSFGAELTIQSYIRHMKSNKPKVVISQPCPAIVTYIQIYQPELLAYLAPADSPMLHTIKMVKHYYPLYANHKVVILSPCIAKKREFAETGIGDFNVTYKSLISHFKTNGIDLAKFPETGFSNPPAERAVLFSTPGGLLATAEREVKTIYGSSRKIEGSEVVYAYFKSLQEAIHRGKVPLLIDCLSCEKGCNGGTGTATRHDPVDILESVIAERKERMIAAYGKKSLFAKKAAPRLLKRHIASKWKTGLYERKYRVLSENYTLKNPDEKETEDIYKSMKKYSEKDMYNCTSCGYDSCEGMAKAIFNGLNSPKNCFHYKISLIEEREMKDVEVAKSVTEEIQGIHARIVDINFFFTTVVTMVEQLVNMINSSSAGIEEINATINNVNYVLGKKVELNKSISAKSMVGMAEIKKLLSFVQDIAQSTEYINRLIGAMEDISERTNLLSMNASIEAAHAGSYGKGFNIVAGEIRNFAKQTSAGTRDIHESLKQIIGRIETTSRETDITYEIISSIIKGVMDITESMMDISGSMSEIFTESTNINSSISELVKVSGDVLESSREMKTKTRDITDSIEKIAILSSANGKRHTA